MAYCIYILANRKQGTLYIGITNDVARRIWEHRQGLGSRFVQRYGVTRLVYVELHEQIAHAIQREKTMKERSEEHTSELQSLMRFSYALFCLQKKNSDRRGSARKPTS